MVAKTYFLFQLLVVVFFVYLNDIYRSCILDTITKQERFKNVRKQSTCNYQIKLRRNYEKVCHFFIKPNIYPFFFFSKVIWNFHAFLLVSHPIIIISLYINKRHYLVKLISNFLWNYVEVQVFMRSAQKRVCIT